VRAKAVPQAVPSSFRYPGYGGSNGQLSRMYQTKEAVSAVMLAASDAEYGLMRYFQNYEWNSATFYCSSYIWYDGTGSSSNCAYNFGVTTFGALNSEDHPRGGQLIVEVGPDTTDEISSWIDHSHNQLACAPSDMTCGDHELRSDGNTPLEATIDEARLYMEALKSSDPEPEREYIVFLITDGEDTCSGSYTFKPSPPANNVENAIRQYDGSVKLYLIGVGAGLAGVPTLDEYMTWAWAWCAGTDCHSACTDETMCADDEQCATNFCLPKALLTMDQSEVEAFMSSVITDAIM
jgi:hypothetical protein